jgi:hypothetical protein
MRDLRARLEFTVKQNPPAGKQTKGFERAKIFQIAQVKLQMSIVSNLLLNLVAFRFAVLPARRRTNTSGGNKAPTFGLISGPGLRTQPGHRGAGPTQFF